MHILKATPPSQVDGMFCACSESHRTCPEGHVARHTLDPEGAQWQISMKDVDGK